MNVLLEVADAVAVVALFIGSLLCLTAAIGLARFSAFYSRVHAAAKPQTLGVLLVLLAVGVRLQSLLDLGMLFLVGVFQMITVPTSGHMTGRSFYDTARSDDLVVSSIERASMSHSPVPRARPTRLAEASGSSTPADNVEENR